MVTIPQTRAYTFNENMEMSRGYLPQAIKLLKQNAIHFLDVRLATDEEDMKYATDFVLTVTGGEVAVRVRRFGYKERDLTIRAYSNGYRTELDKIRGGFARWYLYSWADAAGKLSEWVLVDLDIARREGVFDREYPLIPNRDGRTAFIAIAIPELRDVGCLVASCLEEEELPF